MNRQNNTLSKIDKPAVVLFCGIVIFGLVNMYASVFTYEMQETSIFFSRFGKQLLWMSFSLVVGVACLFIHSYFYDHFAYFFYILLVLLLIVTPFLAHNIKGSLSWITVGPFAFQPAEMAKFATALTVASYMGKDAYDKNNLKSFAVPLVLVCLPALIIIGLQHETGTALVFSSFLLTFYRRGMSGYVILLGLLCMLTFLLVVRYSFIVASVIITLLFAGWLFVQRRSRRRIDYLKPVVCFIGFIMLASLSNYVFYNGLGLHQQKRIELILGMHDDIKGVGYNVNQAKIAIGSGGLTGKGFMQGTQNKLNYVPEHDTDFIFCTVGEEWGFLGAAGLLLLYMGFLIRLIMLAEQQKNIFSLVYIYCTVSVFLFHVVVNIGMVLGLLPVIGIPLPFFSYGGSSFLCFTLMFFVALRLDIEQQDHM